jgi:Kef-type K+ transport system membrane component KefB
LFPEAGITFVLLGAAMLVAYAAHVIGARSHVPRVTILLLVGIACGPSAFDLAPREASSLFPVVAEFALAVVGFLIGEEFVSKRSKRTKGIVGLALVITLSTALLVSVAVYIAGASMELALILGAVSTATAPAASFDLIREVRAKGPLTNAVLGIVAADDMLAVLIFSGLLAGAEVMAGTGAPMMEVVHAFREIGGAVALGVALGIPMARITGRLKSGEPAVSEALGFILLVAGIASLLDVSFILSCMVLGGTVAHRARHYTRAVHEIEGFAAPPLALFFLLAGLQLEVRALPAIGVVGAVYVVVRFLARMVGSGVGAQLLRQPPHVKRYLGMCLLPQAGVALGLALLAAERLPSIADELLTVVVAATVVFEIAGPVLARYSLGKAGEIETAQESRESAPH